MPLQYTPRWFFPPLQTRRMLATWNVQKKQVFLTAQPTLNSGRRSKYPAGGFLIKTLILEEKFLIKTLPGGVKDGEVSIQDTILREAGGGGSTPVEMSRIHLQQSLCSVNPAILQHTCMHVHARQSRRRLVSSW